MVDFFLYLQHSFTIQNNLMMKNVKATKVKLFKIIIFNLLFINSLNAQSIQLDLVDLDSIYQAIGFAANNQKNIAAYRSPFVEKDSCLMRQFKKSYEHFERCARGGCMSPKQDEEMRNALILQQNQIIDFENKLAQADSIITRELQQWCEDYIKQKMEYFAFTNHQNIIGLHHTLLYKADYAQLLHQKIIQFIQEDSAFELAHRDFTTFIIRKTIIHLNLNPIIPSKTQ
jgi:hypothetical protein